MQQPSYTPANAQHVPPGWNFPTLAVQPTTPASTIPGAVRGGGAPAATVTRVRWGRLLPVFAGVLLLGFGMWSVTRDASPTPRARSVSGGGAAEDIDIARAARSESTSSEQGESAEAATPARPKATPARATPSRVTSRRPGRGVVRRGTALAATGNGAAFAAAPAAARRTVHGGGGPNGELPMTGLETWIAGILGVLLLLVGICVHVNAVRIAATAMLYRRGILLRPVDCARLAQERGMPQLRITLSNVLHKLLEEPSRGDFVGTRLAR